MTGELIAGFTGGRTGTWPATFTQANVLDWIAREPGPSILCQVASLAPAVVLTVTWHGRLVAPDEMRGLLRGVEDLLTAAGADDVELSNLGGRTGLRPVERGPDWVRVDSCWIDLAETRRIAEAALRPRPVRLFTVPADPAEPSDPAGGQALVACTVEVPGERNDVGWLHERCMAALGPRHGVRAPQRYLLFAEAPQDLDDWAAWHEREPLATGTPRDAGGAAQPRAEVRS
ncbi:hypothetical protein [Streptomyces sp. B6B3]|uniref:hypothetical protein n=1 Tax=Streptomyces sp. B6B3 TaxID=3153570 RepID=UPI00325CE1CC